LNSADPGLPVQDGAREAPREAALTLAATLAPLAGLDREAPLTMLTEFTREVHRTGTQAG
jgi:hypothetical protein